MAAHPDVIRFKALTRKVKGALDKRKQPPLDAIVELAARGDKPAQKLLAKRSKEDAVLDALIATVLATPGRIDYASVIAESKHPRVRARVITAISGASPHACSELVAALVRLSPGKARSEAECTMLLEHASSATFHVIEFVRAHGTPTQKAEIARLFDRELTGFGYHHVLEAVDKQVKLDSAALFERYRMYFTRDDRETSAGHDRISAIASLVRKRTPIDRRWLDFLLDVVRDCAGRTRSVALWIIEDLGKQLGKRFPHDAVRAVARVLVGISDYQSWTHLFDIIAQAPDAAYAALVVDQLVADIDARYTIEALEGMPKRLVADALHARGIPTLADAFNRERLDALVAALSVHAPQYATAAPKPELLWQLIDGADADGVEHLLAAGISPETPPPGTRYDVPTPLLHAIGTLYTGGALDGSLGVVKHLIAAGARTDVELPDCWYVHDVHFESGDTAATVTRKLLAHVTPPYNSAIQRNDPTFQGSELWMSYEDRERVRPAIKTLAKLM